jgi:hypothetical protein
MKKKKNRMCAIVHGLSILVFIGIVEGRKKKQRRFSLGLSK